MPLSAIADLRVEPSEGQINRRNGERTNTVQAFVQYGVLPEEALKKLQSELALAGYVLPDGYRMETGGDSDARDDTLKNLIGSLGLIVPLSIAAIVLTFNSFRLAAVTLAVAGLSAGLSIFALAVFQYPFGINAIIGVIGSIGVSINAAIIILTGMQQNEAAASGDQAAMVDVVMGSSRHIVSTTLTTFGGFLPLILGGGGSAKRKWDEFLRRLQERIADAYAALQTGDVLATTTSIDGLDVTHTGFVVKLEGGATGFLHASSTGAVKVAPDLAAYVEGNRVQTGLLVARPVDPRTDS